jgi:hypothetical protein
MLKLLLTSTLVFLLLLGVKAQDAIPKNLDLQQPTKQGEWDDKMFNNLNHPLSITGGAFILGGAATYITASLINDKDAPLGQTRNGYAPETTLHFVGIGVFVAGAVLFTIFSTEREVKTPKRKKNKTYNASEWESPN